MSRVAEGLRCRGWVKLEVLKEDCASNSQVKVGWLLAEAVGSACVWDPL